MTLSKQVKKDTMARKPDGIPMKEWLDPMKAKKNWGSDIIPKEDWIDPTKTYKTRKGKRVELHGIDLHNSCGNEVTFPVKGTIVLSEAPRRTRFAIWTLDGKASVLPDSAHHKGVNPSEEDLVLQEI